MCCLTLVVYKQASRDGPTNKVRARMSIASALIFGSVFWRMGRTQTSIQDRLGLLQVCIFYYGFLLSFSWMCYIHEQMDVHAMWLVLWPEAKS